MSRVNLTDLLIFTNQFASMLRSHLPLVAVLRNLAAETPNRLLRDVVEEVTSEVEHGVDFGDALAAYPEVFSPIFVNVVRAGMVSGRLGDALTQMVEFLTRIDLVQRKVRGALSYPAFMFVSFFAVFNAMVFFILPRFAKMFETFGRTLPVPTQILMGLGTFWKGYWWVVLLGSGGGILLALIWLATPEGRFTWDRRKLDLPMVGRMWRIGAMSRFMRSLGVQVQNEVELLRALELAAHSCGNAFLEEIVLQIAEAIAMGTGITQAFRQHEIFSGIVLQMIGAGEEAGNLHELLLSAADYFERLLDHEISVMTGLINPILTVLMGVVVAGMMIATFLPVFDMGNVIK